jgi:hypothetical protein
MFSHLRQLRVFLAVLPAVLAIGVLSASLAMAKEPAPKPPPEPPPAGTIYFRTYDNMGQHGVGEMSTDGSQKQMLLDFFPSPAEPSHDLHGGHRWFLDVSVIAGTYPDGDPQRGLFAVDDVGLDVSLVVRADLEPFHSVRWTDGFVSFVALRWDLELGKVQEAGIYLAQVAFDSETGDVSGIEGAVSLLLPTGTFIDQNGDVRPDIRGHDWSPDGAAIVYDTTDDELFVEDLDTGQSLLLTTERASDPAWCPDGSRIAFNLIPPNGGLSDIATIRPDSGDLTTIIRSRGGGNFRGVSQARWSPTGAHLIYSSYGGIDDPVDIYRATASGGSKTNLTGDTDDYVKPLAWR